MEKQELKESINAFCTENGLSKAAFGKKCGVSSATLSFIENDSLEKISDEMVLKINSFINSYKVDGVYQSYDLLDTCKACDKARKYHLMIGIVADTGMGKTTAIKFYSQQKNVFYVSFCKSMKATQFFKELLREMAVPFAGSLNEMIDKAAEELNKKENPLLIIDEAGKITHAMMLYLQELRDKTSSNCGIVLAGMPYFKANLQKYADKQKEGYAEFLRRVNIWHTYVGLKAKEKEEICLRNGITDMEAIVELKRQSRFGDLMNKIYLYKIQNDML